MYAIAFDLLVAETQQHHAKGVSQAYAEIGASVRDIRAFRIEQWSDFTSVFREPSSC